MSITVKKNKLLEIKKIKMKCDPSLGNIVEPLQDANFCYIISAPPGSGKTSLIMNLLTNKLMYKRRFDKIYWFSPSSHTVDIPIPEDQIIEGYDADIVNDIIDDINDDEELDTRHILFIFDDCVSDLKKSDKTLGKLAFNRRHKIHGGSLSLIFTTQMLNAIPTSIRRNSSGVFIFMTNSDKERDIIKKEYVNLPSYMTDKMLRLVFKKPHNFLFINTKTQNINKKYYNGFDKMEINLSDE